MDGSVELITGPAAESVQKLISGGTEPFDLVFIDADKPSNPVYLDAALKLSRPGTVIVGDNVVRNGAVTQPESDDPRVHGVREFITAMGSNTALETTAVQSPRQSGRRAPAAAS